MNTQDLTDMLVKYGAACMKRGVAIGSGEIKYKPLRLRKRDNDPPISEHEGALVDVLIAVMQIMNENEELKARHQKHFY